MSLLFNTLYFVALLALSPWLVVRAILTGRYRRNLRAKLFGTRASFSEPPVWFHGVSVGEIHLLTTLVSAFRVRHPGKPCVISTTTDTGYSEACKRFPDLTVILWPFDFSWAVNRTLNAIQPLLIVLAESELWPNFLRIAEAKNIPVVVVNGRMSPRSFRRYSMFKWIAGPLLLKRITRFAVQSADYADRLAQLGIAPERLRTTGSIKYDGATADRQNPKTLELRRLLNIAAHDRIWVVGSTHAPEERIAIEAFKTLKAKFPHLRMILVPRSPDRFNEVAQLIEKTELKYCRRSQIRDAITDRPPIVLIDTIGELGAAWGLADVGFVGGSFDGQRGGQSMIEPAAYGVPIVFGPHTWNFRDAVARLLEVQAAIQIREPESLAPTIEKWLHDPIGMGKMGESAKRMVKEQQGATVRTLDVLDEFLRQPLQKAS